MCSVNNPDLNPPTLRLRLRAARGESRTRFLPAVPGRPHAPRLHAPPLPSSSSGDPQGPESQSTPSFPGCEVLQTPAANPRRQVCCSSPRRGAQRQDPRRLPWTLLRALGGGSHTVGRHFRLPLNSALGIWGLLFPLPARRGAEAQVTTRATRPSLTSAVWPKRPGVRPDLSLPDASPLTTDATTGQAACRRRRGAGGPSLLSFPGRRRVAGVDPARARLRLLLQPPRRAKVVTRPAVRGAGDVSLRSHVPRPGAAQEGRGPPPRPPPPPVCAERGSCVLVNSPAPVSQPRHSFPPLPLPGPTGLRSPARGSRAGKARKCL